jgi:thiamine-monophosphate kinase
VTEDDVVAKIAELCCPATLPRAARFVGIGDDAAVWQPSRSHRSVISTDMLLEGVDFTRASMSLEDAGWKAMASNVSDLAAMGARPVLATVALGVPAPMDASEILEVYRGIAACARSYELAIAGGDLSRAGAIAIAITVVGDVRPSGIKVRSGALPGDVLAVTGHLGAARAGLALCGNAAAISPDLAEEALAAFRHPMARVAEGRFLGASRNVRAMIDLSDGLSTDADRLARASGCGVTIESVPVARSARALARARKEDPERFALAGGEDFELLAAIHPRAYDHVAARFSARFGRPLLRVGVLRAGSGIAWQGVELERSGWDHFDRRA